MRQAACLIIAEGDPYLRGSRINICKEEMVLGRSSESIEPDIAFANFLVSRRHCALRRDDQGITLYDLGSKHGTAVNGRDLNPHSPCRLQDGDMIGLAKGVVKLRFAASPVWDETMELGRLVNKEEPVLPLLLDEARRECRVNGEQIGISVKEWDFLWLLSRHAGRLVSYELIKQTVWPERALPPDVPLDVSMDEINTLIYRLRRKLGSCGGMIRTVRGQGCMLETDCPKPLTDK